MGLRTVVGKVEVRVWRGKDPTDGHWGCPLRERWGLGAHQQMSAALEDKLAFTATLAGSYEQAALLAKKWGCEVDGSVIHGLVQRLGSKAEAQTGHRLKELPQELQSQRRASALGVLMMDGWQVRMRGPGWGKKRTKKERVEWHELKTGVFYLHEPAAESQAGRTIIAGKSLVRWQGEPLDFGRRLHWEALRGGLARAKEKLVVADGAAWIWNLKNDRWPQARELLDFYHAAEHLWELGRSYHGAEESKAKLWVERRLHGLRHGRQKRVLMQISQMEAPRPETEETVRKEKNYFAGQSGRMNYQEIAERGWPIGSGPVESACRQSQCRFKRPGQSWSSPGLRNLCALDEARHNEHWDELWLQA